MSEGSGSRPELGRHLVGGVGGCYVLVGVAWALGLAPADASLAGALIVGGFIAGSGAVLLVGSYRLPESGVDPAFYSTIARGCLGGIGVMLGILALYTLQPDTGLSEPVRSIPILTGFSSVAGFGVGLSDARAKTNARELQRKNELLERTRAEVEASNERLEQFAYAASHDLQEPLRMVSSYLQLIERRADDELEGETEEFLEYAIDGSERMQKMIEGLLAYSRVDTEGEPFTDVDLNDVLEDVRSDLEVQIAETDADVEVEPLPTVHGDERQLRQLFQNLVSNAIEYSGEGTPRVEVFAELEGQRRIVSVRDDGIGIDPDDRERIFEVFQRLHSHEEYAGSGIGLALCRRIVERHDGEIRVDSTPGEGSTFSVVLPAPSEGSDEQLVDAEPTADRPGRQPSRTRTDSQRATPE